MDSAMDGSSSDDTSDAPSSSPKESADNTDPAEPAQPWLNCGVRCDRDGLWRDHGGTPPPALPTLAQSSWPSAKTTLWLEEAAAATEAEAETKAWLELELELELGGGLRVSGDTERSRRASNTPPPETLPRLLAAPRLPLAPAVLARESMPPVTAPLADMVTSRSRSSARMSTGGWPVLSGVRYFDDDDDDEEDAPKSTLRDASAASAWRCL
jgi:hypothetical protein